ncbi:hypothetical protein GQ42DRAFT_163004 [Ramicandelaber brevisporus]|nr:hypothetical protein GQ42DRAFT_163004 [Ramicandelaber brevisporus]
MRQTELDNIVRATIQERSAALRKVSLAIHSRPETGRTEHFAAALLSDFLERDCGFTVQRGVDDSSKMPETAFVARLECRPVGSTVCEDVVSVGFCLEYDALPIGHACGHNLLSVVGIAAALAARDALTALGIPGNIVVFGCCDEEGDGGKIDLIEGGWFEGIDIAMMTHGTACGTSGGYTDALACQGIDVVFTGDVNKPKANASFALHCGMVVDTDTAANDAAVMAYQGIALLRQHLKPGSKVHGVMRNQGTASEYMIRASTSDDLAELRGKIHNIFNAAATATGCTAQITDRPAFADMVTNSHMADAYIGAMQRLWSTEFPSIDKQRAILGASTDMANVSYRVPTIHPMFDISTATPDGTPVALHTAEFREAAATETAHNLAMQSAAGLAMTAVMAFTDREWLDKVKMEFDSNIKP